MALTANDFLQAILRSGLMLQEQLERALRDVPEGARADPQALADHFVQAGLLSRFQAHKLLRGATVGLLLGHFRIQFPIARGGMGTVYLAIDTRNQQPVAIKVLPPKKAREKSRYLARFLREMKISQRVVHPHVALTQEIGVHHGVHFIAMEYIPGQSLHRLVSTTGPLAVPRAARIFAEVAAGLEHAHSLNLVHRDLKPSNIMITPKDHAKVLDLGLALIAGEDTEATHVIGGPGYLVGSFDYMAPEQTENSIAVDGRADLYALGCTLYFALTGQPPFPGGGKKEKVHAHRNLRPPSLLDRQPRIPEKFARIVERLMAKNPQHRYPSAAAVRQELLAWAGASQPLDKVTDLVVDEAAQSLADQNGQSGDTQEEFLFTRDDRPAASSFEHNGADNFWWAAFWIGAGMLGVLIAIALFMLAIRALG